MNESVLNFLHCVLWSVCDSAFFIALLFICVPVPVLVLERMFMSLEELKQEVKELGRTQQALLATLVTQNDNVSVNPLLYNHQYKLLVAALTMGLYN
jgi:hypothetical protein